MYYDFSRNALILSKKKKTKQIHPYHGMFSTKKKKCRLLGRKTKMSFFVFCRAKLNLGQTTRTQAKRKEGRKRGKVEVRQK